jgi:two-component system sensor histidine kinase VicK
MTAQLNRLLDATHPIAGPARLANSAPTELIGLVRTCAERIGQTAAGSDIRLESQVEALVMPCDAVLMQTAVSNFIDNGYSPAGRPVEVGVDVERTSERHTVLVSVSDSGVGIPAADIDHIFGPFKRGTNVERADGSGVGLASAREAVQAHGGTIAVASQEGVGTTFTVRLPVCSPRCSVHRTLGPSTSNPGK